jgi:hypothetical protein
MRFSGVQSGMETHTTINTAMKMEINLAQVSQPIWWNLVELANTSTGSNNDSYCK